MPVRPDLYDEVVARVNRKYEDSIGPGDQYLDVPRISTGSLELDAAMGGGVAQGLWTRFYGGWHSAKTLTALRTIANAQKMGLTCAYYNVEKRYDAHFASHLGVDTKALTISQGTSIEEIGDKMESLLGVCHIHVVDSCSIAVSEDELNADIRDWRPGIQARAWGKVFKRINERFDHQANTIILIDQVRVNFKTGSEIAAGGRVFDHQSSMSVLFKKGAWLFRNPEGHLDEKATQSKGIDGQMEPAGYEVKCRVEKSSVCRPLRTATLRWDYDNLCFDSLFEYVKAAKHYKIVEARGSHYYVDGKRVAQGDKQLREHIAGDENLQEKIAETVMLSAQR